MNRRFLQVLGLVSLVVLVLGSGAALLTVKQRLNVTLAEAEDGALRGPDPLALVAADVGALRADVTALADGLGGQLQALYDGLEEASSQRDAAMAADLATLRAELDALRTALAAPSGATDRLEAALARVELALAGAGAASPAELARAEPRDLASRPEPATDASGIETAAAPAPASEAVSPQAPAPPAGKRFLAFELPSQSFAFDRAQRLVVIPSLSRVGFDARSTLHDFTGTTSAVEGELDACLARPAEGCRGRLSVQASGLDTQSEGRDEAMREHLDVERHPTIEFEWTAFEAQAVDAGAQTLRGTARGRMRVRGEARDFAMPVRVAVDASRRVTVEGEATLDLRDFGVPVPNKLGMISMESEVRVWIALRLRAAGPATEARDGAQ